MNNQAIADDLNRLASGLHHRALAWDTTIDAFKEAEKRAIANFRFFADRLGGSISLTNPIDLSSAIGGTFANTRIHGTTAWAYLRKIWTPLTFGFDWFAAILRSMHDGASIYAPFQTHPFFDNVDKFADIESEAVHGQRYSAEIGRLIGVIGSETAPIKDSDAKAAIAAMLLAPLWYPPAGPPSTDALAISLEWYLWQMQWRRAVDAVRMDDLNKGVYEDPPETDLDLLFSRLLNLSMLAAAENAPLGGAPEMRDLQRLRKLLEQGKAPDDLIGVNLQPVPPMDFDLATNFPPEVERYVRAAGYGQELPIYRSSRMTFADARL